MSSGTFRLVAPLAGTIGLMSSLWFDSAGRAYGIAGTKYLYEVDVATATVSLLGTLPIPKGLNTGLPFDVAVDSAGRTVIAMDNFHNTSNTILYELDVATLALTEIGQVPGQLLGISFAPDLSGSTYCQGQASSLGCVPSIRSVGYPAQDARNGFDIRADRVPNRRPGVLLFGTGPASTPFGGGTLCVAGPFATSPVVDSGGSAQPGTDCTGGWSVDFNKLHSEGRLAGPGGSAFQVPYGTTLHCQWLGRRLGNGPGFSALLSNALRFEVQP